MTILFSILANHLIRHQATHKVGCQPGDDRWSLNLPLGLCGCAWVTILTLHTHWGFKLFLIWVIIILSYAFKMRQDYLSTSYLDQNIEIWIDPSNVCWDNPVSFWGHMMIFFSHLSLFYRWNILKIWENLSKWSMDVGPSHLRACYVLTM